MYSQVNQLGLRNFVTKELPALSMAFLSAELFYKFHSFTLECLAFLVTWFALSWLQSRLGRFLSPGKTDTPA